MGQPTIPPTPAGTSLAGKTAIVTGGNTGLGFEAARQFLILKAARVIIAVRSRSRGQEAASALRADPEVKSTNPDAKIDVFDLDLDDYQSVLAFSQKVKAEVKELDILLNNGGVNIMKYQASKNGHERVMQGEQRRPKKSLHASGAAVCISLTNNHPQLTATPASSSPSSCSRSSAPPPSSAVPLRTLPSLAPPPKPCTR
jgi:NAD(P)-dependent dehydrogenase (short-subunit alcohol dehydrogenase family)